MSNKYGDLNPNAQSHRRFLATITQNLQTDRAIPTPKLVDRLEAAPAKQVDWRRSYIRSMLTYTRPYLEDEGYVEIESDPRGGQDTYLWRKLKDYSLDNDSE